MSFPFSDLRMNNIYGSGNVSPPNMNQGINLDEISNILNHIRNYKGSLRADEQLGPHPALQNIGNQMTKGLHEQPQQMGPNVQLGDMGAAKTFADNILNPPERGIPYQKLMYEDSQKKAALNEKKTEFEGKQDINQQRTDISQQRANAGDYKNDIADFKARNPEAKILAPKGGNFLLVDPITHVITDTGRSTGSMTDKERMELSNTNTLGQIGARGDESRKTLTQSGNQREQEDLLKGSQNLSEIAAREEARRKTLQTTPSKQLNLPNQQGRDQFNRAQELFNSDAELKEFVHTDPTTKTFTIDAPSTGRFHSGPTQEQFDRIKQRIYGSGGSDNNDPLGIRKQDEEE